LREERGLSYLFITHDLSTVRQIAEHIYVMYHGRIVESGSVAEVLDNPKDPYTMKLLESVPQAQSEWLADADAGEQPRAYT
jgi:ABC-type dipeptide/oligopeptide/nickel transport system ATPase component